MASIPGSTSAKSFNTEAGTIMGFSSLIVMLGMSLGPIFAGYMADREGNYLVAFTVLGLGALAGSVCFLLAQ